MFANTFIAVILKRTNRRKRCLCLGPNLCPEFKGFGKMKGVRLFRLENFNENRKNCPDLPAINSPQGAASSTTRILSRTYRVWMRGKTSNDANGDPIYRIATRPVIDVTADPEA